MRVDMLLLLTISYFYRKHTVFSFIRGIEVVNDVSESENLFFINVWRSQFATALKNRINYFSTL